MTICVALPFLQCFLTTPTIDGYASQYGGDVMLHTIQARIEWGHLPDDLSQYTVFGAVADCGRIGDEFLVRYKGEYEKGIVTDCAGNDGTPAWMAQNNIIIELDFQTAARWDIVGQGGIEVKMAYIECEIAAGSGGPVAI